MPIAALLCAVAAAGCRPAVRTPPPPPSGRLVIVVTPPGPGIQAVLDGDPIDVPAGGTLEVAASVASHRVQIERDGYYSVWRLVDVPPPPATAELRVLLHENVE